MFTYIYLLQGLADICKLCIAIWFLPVKILIEFRRGYLLSKYVK